MRLSRRCKAASLIMAAMLLPACASVEEPETAETGGSVLTTNKQTGLARIILERPAVKRLALEAAPIRDQGRANGSQKVMPYAALLYGPKGETFTYTRADFTTFDHAPLKIARIEGNWVFLKEGPPAGTKVVTQGGPVLWGVETGIDQ